MNLSPQQQQLSLIPLLGGTNYRDQITQLGYKARFLGLSVSVLCFCKLQANQHGVNRETWSS